jgi:acetyl-CoA synthetase (ADP-forming)
MPHTLSEQESKRLLADYGVPCVADRLVGDPSGAVAAAGELGMPVVAKLSGAEIAHKSERGLVRLGLADADAVTRATRELLQAATPADGDVGVLIAPMVGGMRELIIGAHRDRQFGACVMVGLGGVLAEAIADVSFRLVPLTPLDAAEMLDDLDAQAVLGPVRGEAPADRDALARALAGVGRLLAERDDVLSVDVNPLIVRPDGAPVAVDALVEVG